MSIPDDVRERVNAEAALVRLGTWPRARHEWSLKMHPKTRRPCGYIVRRNHVRRDGTWTTRRWWWSVKRDGSLSIPDGVPAFVRAELVRRLAEGDWDG